MQVKRQQLELDIKQQTGSKLEKEYVKAVYCHLAYLTDMQGTCIYIAEPLCCPPETITTLLTGYMPIQNKKLPFFGSYDR